MLEDYVRTHDIVVPIPHYSTVSRRVKALKWRMPRPVSGDWTMDSTGFGVSGAGEYFNARFNFDPKAKYKKLHVMSDLADGRIIAATFTGSTGKGTGDVSQGRKLLDQVDAVFNSVSADGAYDSETFRT